MYKIIRDTTATSQGQWITAFGDEFPPATEPTPPGSRFTRLDLKQEYSWDGTNWIPDAGKYRRTRIFTSGTSFLVSSDTNTIFCRLLAGGGGGGACTTAVTNSAAGGGGAAGGYAEKTFAVVPGQTVNYTIGGGGASAAAGVNSTLEVGGVTVTAFGGPAGASQTVNAPPLVSIGGPSPAVSTNGDLNASGAPGYGGNCEAAGVAMSGAGGSGPFGGGGNGRLSQGVGNAAVAYGSGGGGGCILSGGASVAGGAGSGGILIVDEFS